MVYKQIYKNIVTLANASCITFQ